MVIGKAWQCWHCRQPYVGCVGGFCSQECREADEVETLKLEAKLEAKVEAELMRVQLEKLANKVENVPDDAPTRPDDKENEIPLKDLIEKRNRLQIELDEVNYQIEVTSDLEKVKEPICLVGAKDMMSEKCSKCEDGTYEEAGFHDDMDGVLHCTKCNKEVKRWKK